MIIFILILIIFAAILYCYLRCFFNNPPKNALHFKMPGGEQYRKCRDYMQQLMSEFQAMEFEEVEIQSFDGLKLHGSYYRLDDAAPIQLMCHGYKGSPLRDFCGGSKLARGLGHNILAIDQRAHGKSGGHSISFGIRERHDVLAWLEYIRQRFGEDRQVILSGVSMGAATVLMCSDMELPKNVKCIMADCPYSSPRAIIAKVCRDMKLPSAAVMPFIRLAGRIFGGFDIDECSAEKALQGSKLPILVIHGEDDRFVPCEMSRSMCQGLSNVRFESFPDAGHGLSFMVDEERYTGLVCDFLGQTVGK